MAEVAISTEGLVKRYGRHRGLAGLDLEVHQGEVYGFLGPNGAGKTTTIRLLLDLIRPTEGRASVLGLDPRRDGVALRRRVGYLAGDFIVDGRQTGRELLTFLGNLRGGVPHARVEELAGRLELDLSRRIKTLSRGNRQKLGVVQAFMHAPELLVLDEPTSGLDPFLQQQFAAMAREARDAGQTIFMSSHVLSEVQQAAERVGIIRAGRLVTVERVETLRERAVRRVEIHFEAPVAAEEFAVLPGVSAACGSTAPCCAAAWPGAPTRWSRPPPAIPWSTCCRRSRTWRSCSSPTTAPAERRAAMLRNVLTKTLWDARRSLLGWALAISAVAAMYAAFWPTVNTPEMQQALGNYPEGVLEALNYDDLTSAAGYLGSSVYGLLVPLLVAVFAIASGTRAVAGDEEAGTLELLLAHPVSRTRLALQRFAALAAALVLVGALLWLAMLAIAGPAELEGVTAPNSPP